MMLIKFCHNSMKNATYVAFFLLNIEFILLYSQQLVTPSDEVLIK